MLIHDEAVWTQLEIATHAVGIPLVARRIGQAKHSLRHWGIHHERVSWAIECFGFPAICNRDAIAEIVCCLFCRAELAGHVMHYYREFENVAHGLVGAS